MRVHRQKKEIHQCLLNVFSNRLNTMPDIIHQEIFNQELLGNTWRLNPRDLLYIFFDVEKEFNITVPQEAILSGRFNTFNNIVQIIMEQKDDQAKAV